MPAAARITDPIGHSPTMNWLLAGLLAGAAIAVVGVAIIGTGGLAAVAIVGAGAAGGAGLGEAMSTMSWAPKEVTGLIAGICSLNVFTNAMPAARAHLDMIMCSKHPGPPIPIATGSGQVYINGMPAARVDDKTGCGGVITKGSGNVFIGGGTVQTDNINPENLVPGWVHAALLVVGIGAAVVLAGPVIAIGGLVLGFAGGYGGSWAGGKLFGDGSDGQKWSAIGGSVLGGWLGAKGAPGAWNLAKRISPKSNVKPSSLSPGRSDLPVVSNRAATDGDGLGKTLGEYSAVEPGPLPDNMAATFAGAKYKVVALEQDTILYRAGTADQPLGQYFSAEPPAGVLQTRIDKAVLPEWPGGGKSPIDAFFAVKVPAGTQVYVGEVGTQSGFYVGGTQQIVVVKPWAIPGVQVVKSSPLK